MWITIMFAFNWKAADMHVLPFYYYYLYTRQYKYNFLFTTIWIKASLAYSKNCITLFIYIYWFVQNAEIEINLKNKIHCKYYARWSSTKYLENYTSLNRWKLLHVVLCDILRFPKNSIDHTYSNDAHFFSLDQHIIGGM